MPNGNRQKQAVAVEQNKNIINNLLGSWKGVVDNDKSLLQDKKFRAMIRYMKEYSSMDSSVAQSKERQLYQKIRMGMVSYSKELETNMGKVNDPKLVQKFIMMSQLNKNFVVKRDGYMKKPQAKSHYIVTHDHQMAETKAVKDNSGKMISCKDVPLFSKEPSYEDLQSGNMKNSGIRAVLGAMIQKNPDFVKEAMLDNNDGTVTVRLFQTVQPVDQGENPKKHEVHQPVYVTVDKSVPEAAYDPNSLWVGIFEKAMVASGMFYGDKNDPVCRPVPPNIDELYGKYKKLPKTEWPTRQECPWLINEKGELHRWKPSYDHIKENGNNANILETILGSQGRSSIKEIDYHPERNEAYKKGRALGTVYSRIIKYKTQSQKEEQRITDIARSYSKDNPEVFLTNLMLCAALLSAMPQKEAEQYLANIKADKNGKITSFPITPEQKLLEHLENEVSARIAKEIKNGDITRCKSLLRESVSQADHKVKHDSNPQIAIMANEKSNGSLKDLTNYIRGQGIAVFSEISGYTKEQENIFKDLEATLKEGKTIVAGTRKQQVTDKKQEKDGLLTNDSYGILGVTKEEVGGKEYKFVLVAGASGINYDYSKNPPLPMENKEAASNGVTKVELNHFCDSFQQLAVTGRERNNIALDDNMLTRNTISQYNNFLTYFEEQVDKNIKDLKSLSGKEEFKKLKGMLGEKKKELTDNLGKDMKSVSFDDMKQQADRCTVIIENEENLTPNQRKVLKRLATIIRLYETKMKNPKGLLLDPIEESMEKDNLLDNYFEDNCAKTVINSHGDILKLQKGLDKVDSRFTNSSKQFDNMKESLNKLGNVMKGVKTGSIPRKEYTEGLQNLLSSANAYLEYKEGQRGSNGGVINATSSSEKERIDMATKIRDYASGRCQIMKHQNLRDAMRLKTYRQLSNLTPTSKLSDRQKEFREIVNSNTLNSILEKADDNTIEKILNDSKAAKTFADKVDLKRNKTNEVSPLERYRNAALNAFSNKGASFDKRENLARLFLADVLKGLNPNMKMGDIRKFEKEFFEHALSSDTLSKCVTEYDISKLDKKSALKMVDRNSISFRREIRKELMRDKTKDKQPEVKLEKNPDKTIEKVMEDEGMALTK